MVGFNMMDNLLDRCLIARGFLGARNRHNPIYFSKLHRNYLFDGCLIKGKGLRQGQTAAEGFPEPIIRELGLRVCFIFPLAEKIVVEEQPESQPESWAESSDPVIRLLEALAAGPLSSGDLRKRLNLKGRPTFRANYLNPLHPALNKGYTEITIPEKPQSRLQK